LQPDAEHWQAFIKQLAATLGLEFDSVRINVVFRAKGIEAAARELRYGWLLARCESSAVLLTAHHSGDQSETMLLRLQRGAGVRGLAAMQGRSLQMGKRVLRPLLHVSRDELAAYAAHFHLDWIEDPSNQHLDIDRNFIRHRILAPLRQRWPHTDKAMARSIRYLREADQLLDTLGSEDLANALDRQAQTPLGESPPLNLGRIADRSASRIKNMLRVWAQRHELPSIPSKRLEWAVRSLFATTERGHVDFPGGSIRRYRQYVYLISQRWFAQMDTFADPVIVPWPLIYGEASDGSAETPRTFGGWLRIQIRRAEPGQAVIREQRLAVAPLLIRRRRGGEAIKPAGRSHRRSLKNIFQENGVPPWERDRWPLVWQADELVCVPGVTVSDNFCAANGELGIVIAPDSDSIRI
jgi:tRNA(Ile)-lysidine synthase